MMKSSYHLNSLLNYIRKVAVVIPVRDPLSGTLRRINSDYLSKYRVENECNNTLSMASADYTQIRQLKIN